MKKVKKITLNDLDEKDLGKVAGGLTYSENPARKTLACCVDIFRRCQGHNTCLDKPTLKR